MDIRRFFGSPPGKNASKPALKTTESNNNNNNNKDSRSRIKSETEKKKTDKQDRKKKEDEEDKGKKERKRSRKSSEEVESHRKQDRKKKEDEEDKGKKERKRSRKSSEEVESHDKKDDVKHGRKEKTRSNSGSAKKEKKKEVIEVQLESDEEFEEVVRKSKLSKKAKSKKGIIYDDSDSEEEPVSKSRRKRRSSDYQSVVIVDSDEERKRKKKAFPLKAYLKATPAKAGTDQGKKTKEESVKKTPVNATDFFGGGSIQRTERKTVATKRKLVEDVETTGATDDMEIHEDDDFEKTLAQLDEVDHKSKRRKTESPPEKKSASTSPSKVSVSSKLSSLAKASKTFVVDSPDRTQPAKTKKASPPKTTETRKTVKPEPKKTPPKPGQSKKSPVKTPSPDKSLLEKKPSSGYRGYLNREGPRSLGSKEIPEGEPNCLEGLTFVITGVLESFERDEMKSFLEKYGAKVTQSLSKKTSYMVVGRDAGESKLSKAGHLGTRQLDEDGVLNLIKTLPGKRSKYEIQAELDAKKETVRSSSFTKLKSESIPSETLKSKTPSKLSNNIPSQSVPRIEQDGESTDQSGNALLWVDKYKPTSLKKIIGQTGEKSNANKLLHWLKTWHKNRALGKKPTGGFFGKDDGSGHRAALLSGPPGVGKTTTATLVCEETGFSYVELNASDTRSKKTLQGMVAQSLNNQTLVDFMGASSGVSSAHGKNHCIIMDEVDGVAGNEDRGGIQELIQLIKQTRIPIICLCNDRNHQKMRSLVNHCFDLRFQKPRLEQIKGAIMSIVFKEGLSIPPPALNEIILAANQDVRQVIHNLSMWSCTDKALTYEQAKQDAQKAKKDMKMGPFDVCRKVFAGGEETAHMSIHDKSDLFFYDYSIAPLFVHENYIHVNPFCARGSVIKHLSQLARTSDSLCDGDLVEKKIRSQSRWGLLPVEAIFASVLPGEYMRGSLPQMVAFPGWLGKNSSRTKSDKILQELHTHMRLRISSDKRGLNMDYLPYLRKSLTDPLVGRESDGVKEVISLMDDYDIIKEDFDNIMEVTRWPDNVDPFSSLSSKTKAAFTRAYNKESHLTPYSLGGGAKKKMGRGGGGASEEAGLLREEDAAAVAQSDNEEEDMEDGMIKAKKPQAKSAAAKAATGKGKGPASGKGKGRGKGKS